MNACMYVFIHAYVGAYMLLIYVQYTVLINYIFKVSGASINTKCKL